MAWLLDRWFGRPFAFGDLRRVGAEDDRREVDHPHACERPAHSERAHAGECMLMNGFISGLYFERDENHPHPNPP